MPDNRHQKGPIGKKSPGPFARIGKFWNEPILTKSQFFTESLPPPYKL